MMSYSVYTGLRELRFVWLYEGHGLLLCCETHELRNGISAVSCLTSTELSHPSSDKRLDVWTQSRSHKSLPSHTDMGAKAAHNSLQSTYMLGSVRTWTWAHIHSLLTSYSHLYIYLLIYCAFSFWLLFLLPALGPEYFISSHFIPSASLGKIYMHGESVSRYLLCFLARAVQTQQKITGFADAYADTLCEKYWGILVRFRPRSKLS